MIIVFYWFHVFEREHRAFSESFISLSLLSSHPVSLITDVVFLTLPDTLILFSSAWCNWLWIFSQGTIIMAHSSFHSGHVPRSGNFTLCQNFFYVWLCTLFSRQVSCSLFIATSNSLSLRISWNLIILPLPLKCWDPVVGTKPRASCMLDKLYTSWSTSPGPRYALSGNAITPAVRFHQMNRMREMTAGVTRKGKNLWVGKNTPEVTKFKHLYLTWFNEFELKQNTHIQTKKKSLTLLLLPFLSFVKKKGKGKDSFCKDLTLLPSFTKRIDKLALLLKKNCYNLVFLVPEPKCGGWIWCSCINLMYKLKETMVILSLHITRQEEFWENRKERFILFMGVNIDRSGQIYLFL